MTQEFFSVAEASKYIGYKTTSSVYSLIEKGLPVIKIDNRTRISKSDIDKFMEAHKVVKAK